MAPNPRRQEEGKMKTFGLLLAFAFFLSIGLSGAYAVEKDSKMNTSSPEVKKEGAGMASAKDTSMKQDYEKYRMKAKEELNEYKMKTKELEAKAKNLKDKAKMEVKEETADLHKKMEVAEEKLKSMESATKSASAEAWEKMKAETDSAMEKVKESYAKVAAHFK